jgi:hypothetical protein
MRISVDELINANRYLDQAFGRSAFSRTYYYRPASQTIYFDSPNERRVMIDISFDSVEGNDYFMENEHYPLYVYVDGVLLAEVDDTEQIEEDKLRLLVEEAVKSFRQAGFQAHRNHGGVERNAAARQKLLDRL